MLIAILPAGGFIILGCLIAGMNKLLSMTGKKKKEPAHTGDTLVTEKKAKEGTENA